MTGAHERLGQLIGALHRLEKDWRKRADVRQELDTSEAFELCANELRDLLAGRYTTQCAPQIAPSTQEKRCECGECDDLLIKHDQCSFDGCTKCATFVCPMTTHEGTEIQIMLCPEHYDEVTGGPWDGEDTAPEIPSEEISRAAKTILDEVE